MGRGTKNDPGQRGISYVELLVVIVIIVIVASLALVQRGSANEQFQRQNAARELKVAFERARFDSVKRRADGTMNAPFAQVTVTPAGFTLRTFNVEANGTATPQDQAYPLPAGIVFGGYGFTLTSSVVVFNRRGESSVTGGGLPQFMACNGNSCPTAPGSAAVSNTVLVTPTGTVNLLPGGISIPSFSNPTVSTTSNTAAVNPDVVLP